jgi:hypothetical protein
MPPRPARGGPTIVRALGEHAGQRAVIPACALRAAVKPLPERLAQDAIVKEYGFGVVGLVGKRDEQGSVRL